jgi:rhodanese-related sulfurtransferase
MTLPLALDAQASSALPTPADTLTADIIDLTPLQLSAMLEQGNAVVVDVREPDEYAVERIEGALLMPLSMFDAEKFPRIFDRTVVLVCAIGKRSRAAGLQLLKAGFEDAHHLAGGMKEWKAGGHPVEE